MKVGIIGLGSMGAPIARRLLAAGHSVRGFNRTRSRADALASDGLIPVDSPAAAVVDVDVLITMVSDDAALEEVLFDSESGPVTDGIQGLVHVGMSTISDALADRLEAVHRRAGQTYVSAPVFGPPEGARNGKLFIAAAGPPDAIAGVRPVLDVLGRVDIIGERPAAANIVKLAGNFLMASAVEGLREAIALVDASGANPSQFIGLITQALFPTPVYQFIGGSIANRAHEGGLAIANPFARSAALAAAAAERLGVSAPVAREIARQRG